MKGKLFKSKPLPPKNEILEYFATQGKPWKHPSEKYYTWHSSIPDKWVSIKGTEFFKHSSQLRYPLQNSDIGKEKDLILKMWVWKICCTRGREDKWTFCSRLFIFSSSMSSLFRGFNNFNKWGSASLEGSCQITLFLSAFAFFHCDFIENLSL